MESAFPTYKPPDRAGARLAAPFFILTALAVVLAAAATRGLPENAGGMNETRPSAVAARAGDPSERAILDGVDWTAYRVGVVQHARSGAKWVVSAKGGVRFGTGDDLDGSADKLEVEIAASQAPSPEGFRVISGPYRNHEEADYLAGVAAKAHGYSSLPVFSERWELWAIDPASKPDEFGRLCGAALFDEKRAEEIKQNALRAGLNARSAPAERSSSTLTVRPKGARVRSATVLRAAPRRSGALVNFNGVDWRGSLLFLPDCGGGYNVVNIVDGEKYVASVLPREIGGASPPAALEAQAVLARTYALKNAGRFKMEGYNLCATTDCQVYGGAADETGAATKATEKTARSILAQDGRPADALFFSTSGGHTAAWEEAFPGPPRPYLPGVWNAGVAPSLDLSKEADFKKFIGRTSGFYDDGSKYFRWKQTLKRGELPAVLKENLTKIGADFKPFGKVKDLRVDRRGPSGRIQRLIVETDAGPVEIEKDKIRWAFGGLKSSMFLIEPAADGWLLKGGGWGHGVGLCQTGAVQMARRGAGAEKILNHYFPGANLVRVD